MKAVEVALSSGQGQISIVWSDLCCHIRGDEVFEVPGSGSEKMKGEQKGLR